PRHALSDDTQSRRIGRHTVAAVHSVGRSTFDPATRFSETCGAGAGGAGTGASRGTGSCPRGLVQRHSIWPKEGRRREERNGDLFKPAGREGGAGHHEVRRKRL